MFQHAVEGGTQLTEAFHQDPTWCASMLEKILAASTRSRDLVGAMVFFCSDASRYFTGQLLYINGGYMASI
jgi:NAD(P)-dependent dehydrogenase (short-subunit alcohol dehydrogenase family)